MMLLALSIPLNNKTVFYKTAAGHPNLLQPSVVSSNLHFLNEKYIYIYTHIYIIGIHNIC